MGTVRLIPRVCVSAITATFTQRVYEPSPQTGQ